MRNFVLVGENGVGKSSFVNALSGGAPGGAGFTPGVRCIEQFTCSTPAGDLGFSIIPDFDQEAYGAQRIQNVSTLFNENQLEGLLYFMRLTSTRLRSEDKWRLSQLRGIWPQLTAKNLWLVLTFAASLDLRDRDLAATHISEWVRQHVEKDCDGLSAGDEHYASAEVILIDHRVVGWDDSCIPVRHLFASGHVGEESSFKVPCIARPIKISRVGTASPDHSSVEIKKMTADGGTP